MTHRLAAIAIVLALGTSGAAQAPVTPGGHETLVVHEWGTFTSVAGPDGEAVEWLPLAGPPDLPCFVEHVDFNVKGQSAGQGPDGNAGPVLLLPDRDDRERDGAVPTWGRDRMVSARVRDACDRRGLHAEACGRRGPDHVDGCQGFSRRRCGTSQRCDAQPLLRRSADRCAAAPGGFGSRKVSLLSRRRRIRAARFSHRRP